MTDAERKQAVLAHCLWMAQFDADYAQWAAAEYEKLMPWLLTNLAAKVRQEIRRSHESAMQVRRGVSPTSTYGKPRGMGLQRMRGIPSDTDAPS